MGGKFLMLVLVLGISPLGHAQVVKCMDTKGNVTFSDGGCKAAQQSTTIDVKPASGKDKTSYHDRSQYSDYDYQDYASEEREQRYTAASIKYQKERKYSADRQNAKTYDDEIKRKNDERMRNMDNATRYRSSNTYYPSSRNCQFIGSQMRCN